MADVDLFSWTHPDGTVYHFRDADAASASDVKYKIYSSVTDLGLTAGSATIAGAYAAMPDSSILICDAIAFTDVPNADGTVEIAKIGASRGHIDFYGRGASIGDYRQFLNASYIPSGTWYKVATERSLRVYTKSTSAKSVAANAGADWTIAFSDFGSTGTPIAVAGYSLDGTGVSQFTIYRVSMDTGNNRFIISARNRDSQSRSVSATVNALFLE